MTRTGNVFLRMTAAGSGHEGLLESYCLWPKACFTKNAVNSSHSSQTTISVVLISLKAIYFDGLSVLRRSSSMQYWVYDVFGPLCYWFLVVRRFRSVHL